MDSSCPSHLIEVPQAIETFAVHAGNTCHTYTAVYGHYCKIVMLAFFHLHCRFNGLYKLCQDTVPLPGAQRAEFPRMIPSPSKWTRPVFRKQQCVRQKGTAGVSLKHLKPDCFKIDGVYAFDIPYQCMQNLDAKCLQY